MRLQSASADFDRLSRGISFPGSRAHRIIPRLSTIPRVESGAKNMATGRICALVLDYRAVPSRRDTRLRSFAAVRESFILA